MAVTTSRALKGRSSKSVAARRRDDAVCPRLARRLGSEGIEHLAEQRQRDRRSRAERAQRPGHRGVALGTPQAVDGQPGDRPPGTPAGRCGRARSAPPAAARWSAAAPIGLRDPRLRAPHAHLDRTVHGDRQAPGRCSGRDGRRTAASAPGSPSPRARSARPGTGRARPRDGSAPATVPSHRSAPPTGWTRAERPSGAPDGRRAGHVRDRAASSPASSPKMRSKATGSRPCIIVSRRPRLPGSCGELRRSRRTGPTCQR